MKKLSILPHLALVATLAFAGSVAQADEVKGSATAGNGKVWLCVGCHSIPDYRADYPIVYRVPMLGGQNAAYIATALSEYKKGERKHPTMRAIAASLSDQTVIHYFFFQVKYISFIVCVTIKHHMSHQVSITATRIIHDRLKSNYIYAGVKYACSFFLGSFPF